MKNEICVFLDCGAPSLYNKYIRKFDNPAVKGSSLENRKLDDFGFVDSVDYKEYRDNYIKFLQENQDQIDVYSNLDVINNPEKTWENQQFLEAAGLHPIPVYHFGCDLKWLELYLKKGYDYLAIGGMIPNPPPVLLPGLDNIWSRYLTDSQGMPIVKVHGFAATSFDLMTRYPFYSVDSTSWILIGAFGSIWVPKTKNGKYIYNESPLHICVSSRSPQQKIEERHINSFSQMEIESIEAYLNSKGFTIGKSEFKKEDASYKLKENEAWYETDTGERLVEMFVEPGVCNRDSHRVQVNAMFMYDFQQTLPPWPCPFLYKKKSGFGFSKRGGE